MGALKKMLLSIIGFLSLGSFVDGNVKVNIHQKLGMKNDLASIIESLKIKGSIVDSDSEDRDICL